MGQLFMVGFDGTTVNDEIRSLIEDHHVGSILLTAKNLKCMLDYVVEPRLMLTRILF